MKSKLLCLTLLSVISVGTHAAEPETRAVEYYHPALKHYFITASALEARIVDTGGAGEGWVRTGRSFGAWMSPDAAPAGASIVYRFYSPGANSHFYSADEGEVRWLRDLEAKERASIAGTNKSFMGWGFEGAAFFAMTPKNGTCAAGTEAIKRAYNRGGADGKDGANHRYMSDDNLRQSMEERRWVNEGTVLCAPVSVDASASGSGNGGSNGNAIAAGSYSGTVEFKYEQTGNPQVKFNVPFTLSLAADGALTGEGGGCKITGSATKSGSATRLLNGSVTATGCTDTRFNGIYGRVQIEQFGAKAIDIRFRQGDNAIEVNIEGVLNLGATTTPPNPNPTPVPTNADAIAGDFSGLAAWVITERPAGQVERVVLDVNQNLALKITSAGVLTGSGQGCTFAGNLVPGLNNRFTGAVAVSGCTNARLNGNYRGEVHPEDDGAIEAEFENEVEVNGARTKVSIKGDLARAATVTPNPNPTPTTGVAIAGKFEGGASILATRRPNGGRETTEVNKTDTLTITISSTGGVTGSGAGCSFTGNLTASSALPGLFGGTITAAGCADGIVNGTYTAEVEREDANEIEFELEREVETNAERVKVKIKGRLAKQ